MIRTYATSDTSRPTILLVHDAMHHERERGEEQVLGELQPKQNPQVLTDLKS